jgi:hypothetical protein
MVTGIREHCDPNGPSLDTCIKKHCNVRGLSFSEMEDCIVENCTNIKNKLNDCIRDECDSDKAIKSNPEKRQACIMSKCSNYTNESNDCISKNCGTLTGEARLSCIKSTCANVDNSIQIPFSRCVLNGFLHIPTQVAILPIVITSMLFGMIPGVADFCERVDKDSGLASALLMPVCGKSSFEALLNAIDDLARGLARGAEDVAVDAVYNLPLFAFTTFTSEESDAKSYNKAVAKSASYYARSVGSLIRALSGF